MLLRDAVTAAWRCQHRQRCCRRYDVPLDVGEAAAMHFALTAAGKESWPDGPLPATLPRSACGDCRFVAPSGCGYRAAVGVQTQPRVCRTYPYVALRSPDRDLLALKFTCPTALALLAADTGTPPTVVDEPLPVPQPWDCATRAPAAYGLDDQALSPNRFWHTLQTWVDALTASEDAVAALLCLAGSGDGSRRRSWRPWDGTLDAALMSAVVAAGGDPIRAATLLAATADDPPEAQPAVVAEATLLDRYLVHRAVAPTVLRHGLHLGRVLGLLAGTAVRWRLERVRGATPLEAVRLTDLFMFHQRGETRLWGGPGDAVDWRTPTRLLAALAGL